MSDHGQWKAFVCPDCRAIFRVPSAHSASGVICSSCQRLLKIPSAGTLVPALTLPLIESSVSSPTVAPPLGIPKICRRKREHHGEVNHHSWEDSPRETRTNSHEKMQNRWIWMLGASALIVAATGLFLFSKKKSISTKSDQKTDVISSSDLVTKPIEKLAAPKEIERDYESYIKEADPIIRKFLNAESVEEILPLVRNPKIAESRIRSKYPDGKIKPMGMSIHNKPENLAVENKVLAIGVRTSDQQTKVVPMVDTSSGLKIDWESWIGWSDISWEKFKVDKPEKAHTFRVILTAVEYYNFDFKDDRKWQSYTISSPDGEHSMYGYVEKGTVLAQEIKPNAGLNHVGLMLDLKYLPGSQSDKSVVIERFVRRGWVDNAEPE